MSAAKPPQWLQPLLGNEPGATLLVGGVGHLLLNREEETVVTAALEARVLPLLRDLAAGRPITLFTGLAPGADLLLMDRAKSWCRRNKVPLRTVGFCAVPPSHLIGDWILRAQKEGYTLTTGDHHWLNSGMQAALTHCDAVVRLYESDDEAELLQSERRQHHYRRLAAVLAQHADMLIAVLQDAHLGQPGGTAEVVTWRQQPQRIPREFSTRETHADRPPETGLILIDPMPAKVTMSSVGVDARVRKTLQEAELALQ